MLSEGVEKVTQGTHVTQREHNQAGHAALLEKTIIILSVPPFPKETTACHLHLHSAFVVLKSYAVKEPAMHQ